MKHLIFSHNLYLHLCTAKLNGAWTTCLSDTVLYKVLCIERDEVYFLHDPFRP